MGDNCGRTRQLYLRLLGGMRSPYCDLSEVDQRVKLREALALLERIQHHAGSGAGDSSGTAADGNGIGSNSVFVSRASWTDVGLLFLMAWVVRAVEA